MSRRFVRWHLARLRIFFAWRRARGGRQKFTAVNIPVRPSRHLDLLRRAGLIRSRRAERHIFSCVQSETVADLVCLFTACC